MIQGPVLQEKHMTVCKIQYSSLIVCKIEDRRNLQEHEMQFVNLDDLRINTVCKSKKYILVKPHKKRKRV